ncbi:scarecrow-like protein 33 [Amaranthus tricolor]|uniref:scarecrow-like protein 33 n=1 Tax=Amaranthus tricolor TaxID=29722 RepID=UPI0025902835|nr:scarecrow-like protein 33 [Amaranthus tricolor]
MNSVHVDSDFMNNIFKLNPELLSNFPKNSLFEEFFQNSDYIDPQFLPSDHNEGNISLEAPNLINLGTLSLEQNESNISSEIPDFPDDCLKFISEILLEENLDENPASAQEFLALQATEKSLYDVLGESYPYPPSDSTQNQNPESPDATCSNNSFSSLDSNLSFNHPELDPFVSLDDFVQSCLELNPQTYDPNVEDPNDGLVSDVVANNLSSSVPVKREKSVKGLRRKKSRQRDYVSDEGVRSNKIQAAISEDYAEMKEYDDVLLCDEHNEDVTYSPNSRCSTDEGGGKMSKKGGDRSRKTRGKKQNIKVDEVDLRTLLIQCAQAVSSFDLRTANELLKQIRQHSSPYGDSIQRLAHHVANGLEARLAGTGSTFTTNISDIQISSSDFLKGYRVYVSAIPFKRVNFFLANNAILKLTEKATKIHIIDFGVFLGLQWPCLIQSLSKRPNGPPKLCITGIDLPQPGFRPCERINATGRRLAGYCERFGVPFEYQGIAEKWENVQPEELKIESDEIVIVNCMCRSGTLLDETVDANSPRDAFLDLIRKLNPNLFIHGIVNGTFTAPFFISRFKEALFHYSSIFEVFEATLPQHAHERQLIESEVYAKELINVVACEGSERIQRPETYKQWQVRSVRAGLRQLPLDREFVRQAKVMIKANYHEDFLLDEDRHWMLQGWKGRIFCALSFWQPS